jgi:SAM-dependent methyltransferase
VDYRHAARFFRAYFQNKRLARMREIIPLEDCQSILDVGGTPEIWDKLKLSCPITLVNSDPQELRSSAQYSAVVGDGRSLTFPSNSFALAFSNSVIEHVGDRADMERFAAELRRVGRSYYCQTPNKYFPIEPHLGTAFVHWVPRLLHVYFVVRFMTLWGILCRPSRQTAACSIAEINLLTRKDVEHFFPDARIITERCF